LFPEQMCEMALFPLFFSNILTNEPISQRIQFQNWGFILFMVCFFIFIYAFNVGSKLLVSMIRGFWKNSMRERIFAGQINNELLIKLLLCLQTVVLCSINLFSFFLYQSDPSQEIVIEMFPFLTKTSLLILIFLLYKSLVYNLAGNIFFRKESIRQWNACFMSILCLSGFVLFLPTLFLFYIEKIFYFCCFFFLIYFIFIIILIFRKIYVLFFPRNILLLYFILYLCAQEIIPLYFLYKGLDYLFIIV
jgi:hypothetical protein